MTKAELVERISKDGKLSKASSEKALNLIVDAISTTLKKGNKVTLVGFGTFSVARRKARMGRNPKTGATIKIPAHKAPKFTACRALKDAMK
ncbi:MAG TPA: HU family DNA-binding protein [Thermodesulfovibrionales bacterium]|nr:HU family DNA-binding protein [Thermodesulfovibrionales bacterium]